MIEYEKDKRVLYQNANEDHEMVAGLLLFTSDELHSTVTIGTSYAVLTVDFNEIYKLIRNEIEREIEAEKQAENLEKYS